MLPVFHESDNENVRFRNETYHIVLLKTGKFTTFAVKI